MLIYHFQKACAEIIDSLREYVDDLSQKMEFRFQSRKKNKYPHNDSDDRRNQYGGGGDVFYFADGRMNSRRNKIGEHFDGGIKKLGNKHQPDRKEKNHPITGPDVEENSCRDNNSSCDEMNAEIMFLRQRMTKSVKGMQERTGPRSERKFLWL
jgi:hypothetical protein